MTSEGRSVQRVVMLQTEIQVKVIIKYLNQNRSQSSREAYTNNNNNNNRRLLSCNKNIQNAIIKMYILLHRVLTCLMYSIKPSTKCYQRNSVYFPFSSSSPKYNCSGYYPDESIKLSKCI